MRAPILALISNDLDVLNYNVIKASEITHAHPSAIEGAKLVAISTYGALNDWDNDRIFSELLTYSTLNDYKDKINLCIKYIKKTDGVNNKIIKENLGNGIAAINSSITAIYFALKYRNENHNLMFNDIYNLGGDTDTIGAMSGGIWGAFNGIKKLDKEKVDKIEDSELIIELSKKIHEMVSV
jgi:poly(ADP-ribose) glycohydrolase ARH3